MHRITKVTVEDGAKLRLRFGDDSERVVIPPYLLKPVRALAVMV